MDGERRAGDWSQDGAAKSTPISHFPIPISAGRPWYREPWPWILMAAPAAAIAGGAVTLWLALSSADGLVADDYYKRGLAINRELQRERVAAERSITAAVLARAGVLRVQLTGRAAPEALFVHLVHATRAGFDRRLRLPRVGPGAYAAALSELPPGRWRVVIEDPRGEWRIVKEGL
jgi:hypothetical protein